MQLLKFTDCFSVLACVPSADATRSLYFASNSDIVASSSLYSTFSRSFPATAARNDVISLRNDVFSFSDSSNLLQVALKVMLVLKQAQLIAKYS